MSDGIDALVHFYEHLTPQSLAEVGQLYAEDARFVDPFNDVTGHAAIENIFTHMFEALESPRFRVTGRICDGRRAALEWRFEFSLRGRPLCIDGASVLDLDAAGRVRIHRDYWDAAGELYAKLPVIGVPIRWLGRRMSAS
jgi:steroid delta-isomerase